MGLRPSVKGDGSGAPAADVSPKRVPPASPSGVERSSPPPPPQREAWTASGQLLLNFHDAISRAINSPEMVCKCGRIAEDMSRAEEGGASQPPATPKSAHSQPSHRLAEEYGAEASVIVENKSKRDALVRNKSVALGVFSFVALRSGRGLGAVIRKTIANRRAAAANSYQFEKHLKPDMSQTAAAEAHPPSRLRRLFRVSFDATVATSITFLSGTFLFMPKPSSYIEDMAQLPLVEGKSVYAEMVCPPLLREYRRVLEKYGGRWPIQGATNEEKAQSDTEKPELTQEDVSLNVIRQFVENCSKRSKYERALLEERHALSAGDASAMTRMMRRMTGTGAEDRNLTSVGKAKDDEGKLGTVAVPPPGVPEWVAVDLDLDIWSLVRDEEEDRAEGQGDESANR